MTTILTQKQFVKSTIASMLNNGSSIRKLENLVAEIIPSSDWWPDGLPQVPANSTSRFDFIAREWKGSEARCRRHDYRIAIQSVLGLYYQVYLEELEAQ